MIWNNLKTRHCPNCNEKVFHDIPYGVWRCHVCDFYCEEERFNLIARDRGRRPDPIQDDSDNNLSGLNNL